MLIALTIIDDTSGSQIVDRIVTSGDPFQAEVSKVLGMIVTPELSQELQHRHGLLRLMKP